MTFFLLVLYARDEACQILPPKFKYTVWTSPASPNAGGGCPGEGWLFEPFPAGFDPFRHSLQDFQLGGPGCVFSPGALKGEVSGWRDSRPTNCATRRKSIAWQPERASRAATGARAAPEEHPPSMSSGRLGSALQTLGMRHGLPRIVYRRF
jgi:hypothetical protein